MSPRSGSGERQHLVTVQQLTETKGESKMVVQTWTALMQIRASKDDASGRERFVASQTTSPYDTTWQIPYIASMDPDIVNVPKNRRILYQGRVYDIVSARTVGFHRVVELETLAGGTVR